MRVKDQWWYFWVKKKYRQIFICNKCGETRKMCSLCGEIKDTSEIFAGRAMVPNMNNISFGIFKCHKCNHNKLEHFAEIWQKGRRGF